MAVDVVSSSSPSSSNHPLQDLIDSGILKIVKRRPDYKDRKPDYVEPEEIYIIGTAHTSQESADAVGRVIREVKPDSVVLEMCKSRSGLTSLNDSRLIEEVSVPLLLRTALIGTPSAQENPALERSLHLAGGRGALLLQYVLTWAVKELAGLLKVRFGEEFRIARKSAEEVGAQVILGDRPIELTLRRAWSSMQPEERGLVLLAMVSLIFGLKKKTRSSAASASVGDGGGAAAVLSGLDLSSSSLLSTVSSPPSIIPSTTTTTTATTNSKGGSSSSSPSLQLTGYKGTDDQLIQTLERFGDTFPYLFESLIRERDRYLAWASKRSKAVNGSRRVVTVIGQLHVKGVIEALEADNGGDILSFKTVARLPDVAFPPSSSSSSTSFPSDSCSSSSSSSTSRGKGGVHLSAPYQKLLGQLLWSSIITSLPRFLRDLAIGTAVAEGLGMVWREVGDDVMLQVQTITDIFLKEIGGSESILMPPF